MAASPSKMEENTPNVEQSKKDADKVTTLPSGQSPSDQETGLPEDVWMVRYW